MGLLDRFKQRHPDRTEQLLEPLLVELEARQREPAILPRRAALRAELERLDGDAAREVVRLEAVHAAAAKRADRKTEALRREALEAQKAASAARADLQSLREAVISELRATRPRCVRDLQAALDAVLEAIRAGRFSVRRQLELGEDRFEADREEEDRLATLRAARTACLDLELQADDAAQAAVQELREQLPELARFNTGGGQ